VAVFETASHALVAWALHPPPETRRINAAPIDRAAFFDVSAFRRIRLSLVGNSTGRSPTFDRILAARKQLSALRFTLFGT
jgi:hypothetical protein